MRMMDAVKGAVLVAVAGLGGGCTAARMAVPAELGTQAAVLPVERKTQALQDGTLRFGAHQVTDYHRGWTFSPSVSLGSVQVEGQRQPYEFRIAPEGSAPRAVACEISGAQASLTRESKVAGRDATSTLEADVQPRRLLCSIAANGTESPAGSLSLERKAGTGLSDLHGKVKGNARLDGVTLDIESSTKLEGGGQLAFTGYHLLLEGAVVGAVETLNAGRVWLAPDLAPEVRGLAVMAASALLLEPEWYTAAPTP